MRLKETKRAYGGVVYDFVSTGNSTRRFNAVRKYKRTDRDWETS